MQVIEKSPHQMQTNVCMCSGATALDVIHGKDGSYGRGCVSSEYKVLSSGAL